MLPGVGLKHYGITLKKQLTVDSAFLVLPPSFVSGYDNKPWALSVYSIDLEMESLETLDHYIGVLVW